MGPVEVTLHVGDAAAARIAAAAARAVPGVAGLRAGGASAAVDGSSARVDVTVVTHLGANCRDVAQAVQRAVVAELAEQAGLAAAVTVTIADVVMPEP